MVNNLLKKGVSRNILIGLVALVFLLVPFVQGVITGEAIDSPFDVNITVSSGSAPVIFAVWDSVMTDVSSGLNEGPLSTQVSINFSVSDADTFGNLDDSTAAMDFSKASEDTRTVICSRITAESSGNFANYTCDVLMWWFDGAGTWDITASISDTNANAATNITQQFTVGSTTGFVVSPAVLTWASITPAATLQEPNEYMILNNTGNSIRTIEINATNLYGETDNSKALYAENFSAKVSGGCGGTSLVDSAFTTVGAASLPVGNYTIGDTTGQVKIYYCLEATNSDLSAQSYSTSQAGAWTIQIAA